MEECKILLACLGKYSDRIYNKGFLVYKEDRGRGGGWGVGVGVVEIKCKGLDLDPVRTIHLTEIGVTSSLN